MSTFRKPLAIVFFLFIFLFSSYTQVFAAGVDLASVVKLLGPFADKGPYATVKEFCDKRSGDLMNLETWYSGKCGKDVESSLRGEGVGFVDIVILQGMEWLFSIFGQTYKSLPEQFIENINSIKSVSEIITDASQNDPISLLSIDYNSLKTSTPNTSLASQIEKSILFMLTKKPASSVDYVKYVATNLKKNHIVDSAFAASPGYGFTALSPILPLWRAFRNISYLLFAVAFVMYGIMIMFRVRIDSKTAATIQLAIPKLITTLLLITFSYAIVGLLIDLSTVAMALSIDILRAGGIITGYQNWFIKGASGQSVLGLVGSFLLNGFISLITTPIVILNVLLGGVLGTIAGVAALAGIAATFWSIGGILIVAFLIALLVSYAKIFFAVIKSYITVIIYLIFSPIILLGNILPGSSAFSGWIMNIIANLAVFPVITFFLVLSYALMMQPLAAFCSALGLGGAEFFGVVNLTSDAKFNFWTPPMTSVVGDIALGTDVNSGSMMLALIGVMLLFMSSKYADMVLEALKVPPFKYGSAMGDSLKMGWTKAGLGFGMDPSYTAISAVTGLTPGKPTDLITGGSGPTATATTPTPPATPCLVANTFVETGTGPIQIKDLQKNTKIWSLDPSGKKILSKIAKISKTLINNAQLINIEFDCGLSISATPNHQIYDKRLFSDIKINDVVYNNKVTNINSIVSDKEFVYDILPKNKSRVYFAGGIPVLSSIT